jgi:hypothetical protein
LRAGILAVTMAMILTSVTWGQDNPNPQEGGTTAGAAQESGQEPATPPSPGFGTEHPPAPVSENPPISGLDVPGLEPHAAPVSYLQLGLHAFEQASSNPTNVPGGSGVHSVTTGVASADLQRLWSNYSVSLAYVGGAGYFNTANVGYKQVQQMDLDPRVTWKRGQLALHDSFSYLPEGNFAGAYGTFIPEGQAGGGALSSEGQLPLAAIGSLGLASRIFNLSTGEMMENLTPRSSVTASGGYAFIHFTGNNPQVANFSFIGSSEVIAQGGYDRILGPHDQGAVVYAYQDFRFSGGFPFHTDLVELMWGHRISGRMDFLLAAGPQFVDLPGFAVSVSGRGRLEYRFPKTTLTLAYDRFITSGSGFFAGARSNIARLEVTRPLGRIWSAFSGLGYARNDRLQTQGGFCLETSGIVPCTETTATKYDYGFAGFGVQRRLGRNFRVYGSYEFNYLTFNKSLCSTGGSECNSISRRHLGTIGLDWTPRPMRLD